jgi:hypothetical protein
VAARVGRLGRSELPGGDADPLERLLAGRAAAVAVLVEEHRDRRLAAFGELPVGHPPAAVERIAPEAEADRDVGADAPRVSALAVPRSENC